MSFPNIWHHRKVADTAARGCDICFKPSSSVLVTPEKQDYFYVCPAHLKDNKFCTSIVDEVAVAAKKKKEMEEEIERVKQEYEEKQRKKKQKEKAKDSEKDKSKDDEKDRDKDPKTDDEKKEGEAKSKDKVSKPEVKTPPVEDEPRVFALQRNFYQARLDKKRQVEMAKRNRERLSDPSYFPSVPKGPPGS
ncbi:VPS4-associated protein 1 [Pseudomassariella vexata]|uniref:VPS4-associated protein 1 n=1 Tax=Pseudomassariella vexata TaxID=1141098 RepID=A0A1Y2E0W6_9PEZI|nr:VPS4-associated protein 1 [Pseudomassariella vexata]ORY64505.1 VPS4-associated protein 1 [Pseudomassariella vexata]